jgi:D-alanyl-D-alanine carboxypeptidase
VTQPPAKILQLLASLDIAPARIAQKNLLFQPEPAELVIAAIGDDAREHHLTPAAAAAWRAMSAAALADGVTLKIVSAFRSIERQAEIVRAKLEAGISLDAILEVSAPPGYSEHHTGRAIDVTTDGVPALEDEFEETEAFRWLSANAARFGFSLSYPSGNPQGYAYEPWHWCHKK